MSAARTVARAVLDAVITEAQFQRLVVDLALHWGWLTYHTHDSRRSDAGWPDLALVRGGRLVLAELKTQRGRISAEQVRWLDELGRTPAEVHLWRPGNWEEIEEVLR